MLYSTSRESFQELRDAVDVGLPDVALVSARVDGNAGNAGRDAHSDRLQHVGLAAASRVAKRRNLVNVRR